jgi:hypothetical protein
VKQRRRISLTFWSTLLDTTSQSGEENFVQSQPMGTFEELVQAFSKQDHKVQMDEQVYMSL